MKYRPPFLRTSVRARARRIMPISGPGNRPVLIRHVILAAIVMVVANTTYAKTKFDAKLSLLPRGYFENIGNGTSQYDAPIVLEPSFTARSEQDWRIKINPYLYSDPLSKSSSENFLLDFNEASFEWRPEDWNIDVGLNPVSWGVTDVFNPLDVASARRFIDPLNAGKRAVPSLILKRESGDWRWEALYIPVQLPAILPGQNSRWLPRDVTYNRQSDFAKVVLPTDLQYSYKDINEIDGALHHNFGGRIEMHKSGVDLSAIFFQGAPTVPSISPELTGNIVFDSNGDPIVELDSAVKLRPDYYLRRTVGASAVMTLDTAIVRFAVANSDRISGLGWVPGWSQTSVLGLEKNFGISNATLTTIVQLTYARHELRADNLVTSVDRIFDQSGMLAFRLSTANEWVFMIAGIYENIAGGTLVQAKVDKKLADGLSAQMEAIVIDAPSGTPLGSYSRNDRIGFGLNFFF